MANNLSTDDDFVTKVRDVNRRLWDNMLELRGYQTQWGALDCGRPIAMSALWGDSKARRGQPMAQADWRLRSCCSVYQHGVPT